MEGALALQLDSLASYMWYGVKGRAGHTMAPSGRSCRILPEKIAVGRAPSNYLPNIALLCSTVIDNGHQTLRKPVVLLRPPPNSPALIWA
jgi:hypothetical protein